MKKINIFFYSLLLLACSEPDSPEKPLTWEKQYERITHITFPKNYIVISNPKTNADNLIKKTIIDIDRKDCIWFYKDNGFKPVTDSLSPLLFESSLMDSIYRIIPNRTNFLQAYGKKPASPKYFNYNTEKTANWVYLLDTSTCRLYCFISNADLNGYAK